MERMLSAVIAGLVTATVLIIAFLVYLLFQVLWKAGVRILRQRKAAAAREAAQVVHAQEPTPTPAPVPVHLRVPGRTRVPPADQDDAIIRPRRPRLASAATLPLANARHRVRPAA